MVITYQKATTVAIEMFVNNRSTNAVNYFKNVYQNQNQNILEIIGFVRSSAYFFENFWSLINLIINVSSTRYVKLKIIMLLFKDYLMFKNRILNVSNAMLAQTSNSAIDVAFYLRLGLPIKIAFIEFLGLYKTEQINKKSRWEGNLISLIWR